MRMRQETLAVRDGYPDNMKHREKFMMIYKSRWYEYFFSGICIYICIAPLILLEATRDNWQLSDFGVVEQCCMVLMVDPILVLVFVGK